MRFLETNAGTLACSSQVFKLFAWEFQRISLVSLSQKRQK